MTVTAKLFATLRDGRFGVKTLEVPPESTVADLVRGLGLSDKDVALILVNGRHADLSHRMGDGETIALFPPIGGG